MKHCPTCQTEYDEEVILFCTKDGTPLVDKEQPVFTDKMPSESSDQDDEDEGAETIIRRKPPVSSSGTEPLTPSELPEEDDFDEPARIVIPTEGAKREQAVRPKPIPQRRIAEPKGSNTAIVVLLTIIATVLVLLGAFAVYWFISGGGQEDNSNLSINENMDLNENVNDTNFNLEDLNLNTNANLDANFNLNTNTNFNLATPSPTRTPSPSPSPSPSPDDTPDNTNTVNSSPTPRPTLTIRPTAVPSPVRTPSPSTNTNRPVNVGTINGRAVRLPTPAYPSAARDVRAAGRVVVSVTIDSDGNVISAKAINGHPLLRSSAEDAARKSKFHPVSVNGEAVAANGSIIYNFVN